MQTAVHVREGEGLIWIRGLHTQICLWAYRLCLLRLAEDQAGHVVRFALVMICADVVPSLRRGWLLCLAGLMISGYVCLQWTHIHTRGLVGFAGCLATATWVGVSRRLLIVCSWSPCTVAVATHDTNAVVADGGIDGPAELLLRI